MTIESSPDSPPEAQPTGPWMMRWMHRRHRRRGYRMMDMDLLFLTTIGKRSGEPRVSALSRFPDGENSWLIAASAAGRPRNPDWYYNLEANPERVWIEIPGRKLRVIPEILGGEQREEAWEVVISVQPRFAGYQKKTDRIIPLIRLTPAPSLGRPGGTADSHGEQITDHP